MTGAEIVGLVAVALKTIGEIVDSRATRAAAETVDAIEKVLGAVQDATTRHVTPEQAASAIGDLGRRLRDNDAAADEKLRQRFADDGGREP